MTIVVTGIFLSIMFNVCTPLVYAVEETELIKEDENNSQENRVEDEIEESTDTVEKVTEPANQYPEQKDVLTEKNKQETVIEQVKENQNEEKEAEERPEKVAKKDELQTQIKVTEIDLGNYNTQMSVGEKQLLMVGILPLSASNQPVTYCSDNQSVASVNGFGRITAVSEGTATITATCGDISSSFRLMVKNVEKEEVAEAEVREIDLGEYKTEMTEGEKQLLSVSILPAGAMGRKISYSSSDQAVASVNGFGRIHALSEGIATITVKCGEKENSFQLTVKKKKSVTIEISDYEEKLKVGNVMRISAKVYPIDTVGAEIEYESSDEAIATVNSSGEVKGISKGQVTIKVSACGVTENVKLDVVVATKKIELENDYYILKPGQSGKIKATVFPADAAQELTFKASDSSIVSVSDDGDIKAKKIGNTSVIVSNGDVSISATVIVNASGKQATEENEIDSEFAGSKAFGDIRYSKIIKQSECSKITGELLRYIYENEKNICVLGNGYTIRIDGDKILNYENELSTSIVMNSNKYGDCEFSVNDGNNLCGEIVISFDSEMVDKYSLNGKKLFLYNEAKNKYEKIYFDSLDSISITKAGKYMFSDGKKRTKNNYLAMGFGGTSFIFVLLGIYVGVKKQYWFW